MKRFIEDNTVSVLQKAIRYFHIHVTNATIKESLQTHPNYPTFKSICDVLEDFKIECYPLKYNIEELIEVKTPYIAHFKEAGGQLVFVTKIEGNQVYYYDSYSGRKRIDYKEFQSKVSGALIVLNADERSGEKNFRKKWQNQTLSRALIPVMICTLILLITVFLLPNLIRGTFHLERTLLLLFATKISGIVLSALLVAHEYEAHIPFADKICHLNKATSCNTVLKDNASKVFGWFGWADIGFIYFAGGLLVLVQNLASPDFSLFVIFAALALPYTFFSVYYQGFVLKKWCPFCLGVQLILVIEFVLLIPLISNLHFSLIGVLKFALTFIIVALIYINFFLYHREKSENESHYLKYMALKKNPAVLRALLLNQKNYYIPVTKESLVFGEKNSSLQLTVFLSLNCQHCARAFEKIKGILNDKPEAQINIIIVTAESKILNTLYYLSRYGKNGEALDLLSQWFSADNYSRGKISETLCSPDIDDVSKDVRSENLKLYRACNVIGTPTFFVNGYLLPRQYEIDDINLFSKSLLNNAAIIA